MQLSYYTAETISGLMSLRKPQKASLLILDNILNAVPLQKGANLQAVLDSIHSMYHNGPPESDQGSQKECEHGMMQRR